MKKVLSTFQRANFQAALQDLPQPISLFLAVVLNR